MDLLMDKDFGSLPLLLLPLPFLPPPPPPPRLANSVSLPLLPIVFSKQDNRHPIMHKVCWNRRRRLFFPFSPYFSFLCFWLVFRTRNHATNCKSHSLSRMNNIFWGRKDFFFGCFFFFLVFFFFFCLFFFNPELSFPISESKRNLRPRRNVFFLVFFRDRLAHFHFLCVCVFHHPTSHQQQLSSNKI